MFLFREGEAPTALSPPALSPGGGRFFRSVVVGFVSGGSPKWRQSVEEKSWPRWRLFGVSELEVCGGGAPATSRDGGGQVEAEEMRVLLMESYPSTRPASLTCGPTEIGRVWFGHQAC
ncbi:hypothetical protein DY000_02039762 [Brassica cretica]|uniref:Uncharacterized protein n=1 Tax=Brassica cretica TaxID=69181 RepID=A0ABQ7BQV5_BRACR|nr:hypothetical protein DY000_02039762 [Brassica cretica]